MALTKDMLIDYMGERMGVDTKEIDGQTPLFSSSLLDSFSMMDLIMFIEQNAGFRLDPLDVSMDNLDSIERILGFVESRAVA